MRRYLLLYLPTFPPGNRLNCLNHLICLSTLGRQLPSPTSTSAPTRTDPRPRVEQSRTPRPSRATSAQRHSYPKRGAAPRQHFTEARGVFHNLRRNTRKMPSRWLGGVIGAMGTSAKRGYRASKTGKLEPESCDVTMPMDLHDANVAMAVAREAAKAQDGQVEGRMVLMEMATRLRVALFTEIFSPTERAAPVSCSGSAIVERLVSLGFARDSEEAAVVGNRLVLVGALSAVGGPTIFMSTQRFRYRFAVDRYAQLADAKESHQLVDGTRIAGAMGGTSSRMMAELSQSLRHPEGGVSRSTDGRGCTGFSGSEVVNWLLGNNIAGTRADAVCIASALVRAGVFFADGRNFVDGDVRYCFSEDIFASAATAAFRC